MQLLTDEEKDGLRKVKLLNRLWAKSYEHENHWLWLGYTDSEGHGRINLNGKVVSIGRASAHIHFGLDLNSELHALHREDICMLPNCWNPDHLYIGTNDDNMKDRRGRKKSG